MSKPELEIKTLRKLNRVLKKNHCYSPLIVVRGVKEGFPSMQLINFNNLGISSASLG